MAEKALSDEARATVEGMLLGADSEDANYRIADDAVRAPLSVRDLAALVEDVKERVSADRLVFPDADDLIERASVALMGGNLILHGPPGTGKTHLARLLADAFRVDLDETTGTPGWSTYDVIGGLRPAIGPRGSEVLQPWLGTVTAAAVRCGRSVEAHLANDDGPQANWVLIDELSRADIDKAIGPLYTALSGGSSASRQVRLWFETDPARSVVVLPERFRILATMNDVDTAFVNQLSEGLQRRFKFVFVGVPTEGQTADELAATAGQAAGWYGRTYAGISEEDIDTFADAFLSEDRVEDALTLLRALIDFLRWGDDGPRWPVGPALLADVLQQLGIRAYVAPGDTDLTPALDKAIADELIPVASGLTEEELEPMSRYLADSPFEVAAKALGQLRAPHRTPESE